MAYLTPDTVFTLENGLVIKQKIIPDSLTASKNVASWIPKGSKMKPCKKLNDNTGKPRGICVHNTEKITVSGTTMSEQYSRATYNGNMGGVIVTFYVDETEAWQILNENEQGWHATDGTSRKTTARPCGLIGGNVDCISIEVIGNSSKAEENGAKLVAYLLGKYNLEIGDVYSHNYFYSGKNCPVYILPHWNDFKKTITGFMGKSSETTDSTTKITEDTIYRIQLGAFSVKENADNFLERVKTGKLTTDELSKAFITKGVK